MLRKSTLILIYAVAFLCVGMLGRSQPDSPRFLVRAEGAAHAAGYDYAISANIVKIGRGATLGLIQVIRTGPNQALVFDSVGTKVTKRTANTISVTGYGYRRAGLTDTPGGTPPLLSTYGFTLTRQENGAWLVAFALRVYVPLSHKGELIYRLDAPFEGMVDLGGD